MLARGLISGLLALVALAGCCPRGNRSITVDGVKRTYQIYVPSTGSSAPAGLVVALHPFLLNGCQMRQLTGFDEVAARGRFVVAYPDGIGRRWDVTSGGDSDVRFICALVDELTSLYNIDPARVYATGASNGAMMCHVLACRVPQKFAAIAPVMGTPPLRVLDACPGNAPMPVLMIHGASDPIVPYEGMSGSMSLASAPATAAFWAKRNGCAGDPVATRLPDAAPDDGTTVDLLEYACGDSAPVLLYRVNGGGHTWPGSGDYFPRAAVGRVSGDMNASEVIWEFFNGRRRD